MPPDTAPAGDQDRITTTAAGIPRGWPKFLFHAQALVLGLAVGQLLAAHGV